MRRDPPSCSTLESVLIAVSVLFMLINGWAGRFAMNPDGMDYLDVGASFFRRDWAQAFNAWWSPLYPWTVGLVLGWVKPVAKWEFPLVQLVNFGIALVTLWSFRYLLHGLIRFSSDAVEGRPNEDNEPLPAWMMILIGYPIFLWVVLEVVTVYDVSPDLAVVACFCFAMGALVRLSSESTVWQFAAFGVILGIGYCAKTILFPLGFVTLAAAMLWRWRSQPWRRGILIAGAAFVCTCAPLIVALSHQKGRITFGDSGRINYAWYVAPRTYWRHWQGKEPGSGIPKHPTRLILEHPPIYEFDGPVVGTYPPSTDPSYWNEGLQWHFALKPQIEVLMGTVPSEVRLLFRAQPALVAAIVVLALLSGSLWLRGVWELWPVFLISLVGLAAFIPVLENDRYLGGPLLVLFVALLAAVQLRRESLRVAGYLSVAVFFVMGLATVDYTVRVVTGHFMIPGVGPNSTEEDVAFVQKLSGLGLRSGDKIAMIGDGGGAYWAELARLHIVAEIMAKDAKQFWNAPPEVREKVYATFAKTQAKALFTLGPTCPCTDLSGWEAVAGTPYYVHRLQAD